VDVPKDVSDVQLRVHMTTNGKGNVNSKFTVQMPKFIIWLPDIPFLDIAV